jgi:hypothetical protein
MELRSGEHLLTGTYASRRLSKEMNLNKKTSLKLKINPIREYLGLIIYQIKPSAASFFSSNLVRLSL